MTRDAFDIFCDELSEAIPHGRSSNGYSLLREERLLIFLWWAKGSAYFHQEAFSMDVSDTVIQTSIEICTKVSFTSMCLWVSIISFNIRPFMT